MAVLVVRGCRQIIVLSEKPTAAVRVAAVLYLGIPVEEPQVGVRVTGSSLVWVRVLAMFP